MKFVLSLVMFYLICHQNVSASTYSTFNNQTNYSCSKYEHVGCSGLMPTNNSQENRISILPNGFDSFNLRIKSLLNAKKSIRIQALVFQDDTAGNMFGKILKQKAQEGLDVSIIVDGMNNFNAKNLYKDLSSAGVEVLGYDTRISVIIAEGFFGANPGWLNNRYHEKIWVVDGEEQSGFAIMGGMNVGDEYFRIANETKMLWTDMDIAMKGPIVKDAMRMYDRNRDYFRYIQANIEATFGIGELKTLNRNKQNDYAQDNIKIELSDEQPDLLFTNDKSDKHIQDLEQIALSYAQKNITPKEIQPKNIRLFQSRPRVRETYIEQVYVNMINEAEKEVLITAAYFIPSDELVTAIRNAAKRGVKVYLITNSSESNDVGPMMSYISRHMFHSILSINADPLAMAKNGSIQIYEWRGASAKEGTLHAKWMVVDRRQALVGSYNLDPRSHYLNSESIVTIDSPEVGLELAKIYHTKYLQKLHYVEEVSPADAENWYYLDTAESINTMLLEVLAKPLL